MLDYRQKRVYAARDFNNFNDVLDEDSDPARCKDTDFEKLSMLKATLNFSVTNNQVSIDKEKLSFQNGKPSDIDTEEPFETLHYDLERLSDKQYSYIDRETAI